jgi:hypothetical protein
LATFAYPVNSELTEIAQVKTPVLTMDDPLFDIMPINNHDTDLVQWEQRDDYIGLQQLRGINGEPAQVKAIGGKLFQAQPGVYGEFLDIDEKQLTSRRKYGSYSDPIDISDLVLEKQNQLLNRRIDRLRWIGWTLLSKGIFSVALPNGSIAHTDAFPLQTQTRIVAWTSFATAQPLNDFRAAQLKARANGVYFDQRAKAFCNRVTVNNLLQNTNAADLGGKRTQGLANMLSLSDVNMLLTGEGLPNIVVYDEVFKDDTGTVVPFIADNVVVIIGARRNGDPVAEYMMTRNAQNDDLGPGAYMMVEDTMAANKPPRYIKVHDGHNGGPAIYYPSSIIVMSVG